MNDTDTWLQSGQEAALEPDLPICDPHHHLWDRDGHLYGLHELLADTGSGHNVRSTVFIECMSMYRADGPDSMKPVGETEYVNGIAAMSASGGFGKTRACAGIVGYADLNLGAAVAEVLEAHKQYAPERFRGIRHASAWDAGPGVRGSHTGAPPEMLGTAKFREGFAELQKAGLSYDSYLFHPQIHELTALAAAFPETMIISDHVGTPLGIGPYSGKQDEVFPVWQAAVSDLARQENVVMKLGGLAMKTAGHNWHKQDKPPSSETLAKIWGPYILHCIDAFGPDRCMFESNFPVDKVSCGYAVLWNAFKRIAANFNASEKAALFHDTASRVYRLNV